MKCLTASLLATCVSASSWAANICNETVPSNRIIDGIPAYQQCTDSTSASIYSNNGVDTATSSGGSDWVRTQSSSGGSGGYQCTELAHRYLYFRWGIKNVPNGNAGVWCDGTIPSGLEKTSSPVHGDLIVFAPGSCGASQTTGHVAVVDVVNTDATVTFVEQNSAGRRNCRNDLAACFLHASANSGAAIDGGVTDGPTAPDSGSVMVPDASVRPDRPADNQRPDVLGAGGAMRTGGTIGGGGALGTGGTGGVATGSGGAGAGGAPGHGGQTGSGGTTMAAGTGGTGGATSPGTEPSATSSSGCSCRVGERPATSGFTVFLAFIAGTALHRRRRVRRGTLDGAPSSPETK